MKSSTHQLESASTPGIFQPVFSGSSYGQPVQFAGGLLSPVAHQAQPLRVPPHSSSSSHGQSTVSKQSRYMNSGSSVSGTMLPPLGGLPGVLSRPLRKGGGTVLLPGIDQDPLAFFHGPALATGKEYGRSSSLVAGNSLKKRRAVRAVVPAEDDALAKSFASNRSAVVKADAFESNFSLFNAGAGAAHGAVSSVDSITSGSVAHQDTWNIFSASTSVSVDADTHSPAIGAVDLDFANELAADGLADSLLNTATAVAEQQRSGAVSVAPFPPLPGILAGDLDSGGGNGEVSTNVWSEASLMHQQVVSNVLAGQPQPNTDTSSTASSSPGGQALVMGSANNRLARDEQVNRPELSEAMIEELNDVVEFKKDERYQKHIIPYREKISFPIGEGGRELLRACLNVRGCKGRQLQGASVPVLLQLAHQWNLWDVALRIKIERQTGQLSPAHEAFVRFKATQSQMRKFVRKEYMVTERDQLGKIARIHYDENRKIKLGKDGRESLRAKLRRLHDKHASRMDELLAQHGFKYSELRNATVQQLGRMAFVCNLWDQVISACRSQEEKRDGKGNRILRNGAESQFKLPLDLINEPIVTDENGQMSNDDARRTMDAVSQLLQQNYGQSNDGNPDIFSSTTFAQAFGHFGAFDSEGASATSAHDLATSGEALPPDFVDIKKEPRDDDDADDEPDYEPSSHSPLTGGKVLNPSLDHLIIGAANAFTPTYQTTSAETVAAHDLKHSPLQQQQQQHMSDASDLYNNFDPSTGGFF